MKNMNVSKKLTLGFGVILLSICVLGFFSVNEKRQAANQALDIVNKSLPEIFDVAELREAFNSAYLHMRTYRLTRDSANYTAIQDDVKKAEAALDHLNTLVRTYPELTQLQSFTATFRNVFAQYTNSLQSSHSTLQNFLKNQTQLESFDQDINQRVHNTIALIQKEISNASQAHDAVALSEFSNYLVATVSFSTAFFDLRAAISTALTENDSTTLNQLHKKITDLIAIASADQNAFPTEELKQEVSAVVSQLNQYAKVLQAIIQNVTELNSYSATRSGYSKEIHRLINDNFTMLSRDINQEQQEAIDGLNASRTSTIIFITLLVLVGAAFATYLTKSITNPLNKSMQFAQAVAQGKLDEELHVNSQDELGKLCDALRAMVSALKENIVLAQKQAAEAARLSQEAQTAMEEAKQAQVAAENAKQEGMLAAAGQLENIVEAVFSSARSLSAQVTESEKSVSESSDRITETASAMEEMNSTVLEVARSAGDATHVSNDARAKAEDGANIVQNMVKRVAEVEGQSQQLKTDMIQLGEQAEAIGTIMNVISDIADQTNLLALNAAIEAARAGEAGRGFAVVADEVRKLAEKTMQATVEVGSAIAGVQTSVERNMKNVDSSVNSIEAATNLAHDAGQSLHEIVHLVDSSADQIRTIATAAEEQSATSEEINRSLTSINHASTETSHAMGEATKAVMELTHQAEKLERIIKTMKEG